MSHAAVYARRSTEQVARSKATKSVTRQQDAARAWATSRGWTVDPDHIYTDDGISGAEFERRPGLQRMLKAAQSRAFEAVIVSEQKSLGRESSQTQYLIKQLAEAGVEVWSYMEDKSLTPKNWLDKAMSAMRAAADEAHREDTAKRVHEAHAVKAAKGFVVGGRVFAYRNVNVYAGVDAHGRPEKSHVDRVIEPDEAAVVRRIFDLYAAGEGLKRIAKRLNAEGALAPRPFVKRSSQIPNPVRGWAPSTVRTILTREIYRGVIVWNRSRKRNPWGKVDQKPRPSEDRITAQREDLRIVDDHVWSVCASRLGDTTRRSPGRPSRRESRNLLAGLAVCASCGGGFGVGTYPVSRGSKERIEEYICWRRRHQGTCTNALRVPVDELNETILNAIEAHALTPEAVEQVVSLSDDISDHRQQLAQEHADIERRLSRLREAVEVGGDVRTLVTAMRELEAKRDALAEDLASAQPAPRLPKAVVADRLTEWRRQLRSSTPQARAVLQRIIDGRITFTPHSNGYEFSAQTRFDRLFEGVFVPIAALPDYVRRLVGDRRTMEYIDSEYSRVLERAQKNGKRVASPPGFEPGFQP